MEGARPARCNLLKSDALLGEIADERLGELGGNGFDQRADLQSNRVS